MGRYSKKKKKSTDRTVVTVLSAIALVLLVGMIWLAIWLGSQTQPTPEQTDPTTPADHVSTETIPVSTGEEVLTEATEPPLIELSDGLVIQYISSYAGIYMEDGSWDAVTDVMMLLLENTSDKDLQLARISVEYPGFTAKFEVSNLPAGEKIVALELNRNPKPAEAHQRIQTSNVVFFPETMSLQEERIRITGTNGSLEVENISGEDIAGDIWIYYKHSASDILYGGITYRVSVKGGLAAGEKTRVIAGHHMVNGSRILMVDCGD